MDFTTQITLFLASPVSLAIFFVWLTLGCGILFLTILPKVEARVEHEMVNEKACQSSLQN